VQSKIVLITGASSGIGAGIARVLAAAGHTVVLGARRTDRLRQLAEGIGAAGGAADAQALDVTDLDSVTAFVTGAEARHGRVDVLVNNAGLMPLSAIEHGHVDEWNRMIDVNIRGVLHGIHAGLPAFRRGGSGHIVNIASIGAHRVSPTAAVYCATKYAVWAIGEGLRQELDPSIRVSTISPGVVESELAATITDPDAAALMRTYRAASIPPESIGNAVAYAIAQPDDVDVNEIVVLPTRQR
jgi:NADP-dependent 3-hydroxy acid dehydrogenase YdfG